MIKNTYKRARKVFQEIKLRLEDDKYKENIKEFEEALNKLIIEYDTSNWENRFVVGGVSEILFCALLRSVKFQSRCLKEPRYDVEINGVSFSLKSNFIGSGDIRLINILGDKVVRWEEPTLFFVSGLGICYADPQMRLKIIPRKDALTINVKEISSLIEKDKKLIIKLKIPKKSERPSKIKIASSDVVKSILREIKSIWLEKYLP